MKIKTLVDRFGSNRLNADRPGELLRGCTCIAIPFAGGMCEIPSMTANIILVNDLDRAVINLAETVKAHRNDLVSELEETAFHPDVLAECQDICRRQERSGCPTIPNLTWAWAYFVCSWMTRGGKMGSRGEFDQGLSIRWKSTGGDSVTRFRNATEGLAEWSKVMRRCTFTTLDALEFLAECKKRDVPENGVYVDAPWPDAGDKYVHQIDQLALARLLASFERTKIVVRFGDHPLVRELYPADRWVWNLLTSRTQANQEQAEVLLTNRLSAADSAW